MGSPDLWDAVCFSFIEDVSYMVCEGGAGAAAGGVAAGVLAEVEDMFSDV